MVYFNCSNQGDNMSRKAKRVFNQQTTAELTAEHSLKYIVLVTRDDGSKAAYGPMTANKAVMTRIKLEIKTLAKVEVIYLTPGE